MTMKIENYEGTADTFTFPYNPKVFDDSIERFVSIRKYNYAFTYYGLTDQIKSPRKISITGHFSGATKESDYKALAKHCSENKLKKLYFSSDKFMIVIPTNCKRTHSGGRTNFIDYVANFTSPFNVLFSASQKNGNNTSSEKNDGNISTPIEKITGTVDDGDTVIIKTGDGDGIEFTVDAGGNTGASLTIYLIKLTDLGGDIYITEYYYAVVSYSGTDYVQKLKNADVNGNMIISLPAGTSLNTLFSGGSVSNITNPTFYFRDGYSSD